MNSFRTCRPCRIAAILAVILSLPGCGYALAHSAEPAKVALLIPLLVLVAAGAAALEAMYARVEQQAAAIAAEARAKDAAMASLAAALRESERMTVALKLQNTALQDEVIAASLRAHQHHIL